MFGQLLFTLLALGIPPHASLRVATVPSGLDVWVDGTLRGVSPILITELPVGTHAVRSAVPRAWAVQPVDTLVHLGPGLTRMRLTLPATLHLISHPPGAVVAEGGLEMGRCPLVLAGQASQARHFTIRHGGEDARRWGWIPIPGAVTVVTFHPPWPVETPGGTRSRMPTVLLGLASVAMAASSVVLAGQANDAYEDYRTTANPERARSLFLRAQRLDRWSSGLWTGFEISAVAVLVWVAAL